MFSARLPGRLEPNRFSRALARARASGRTLVDLTETNPTRVGILYPPALVSALADPGAASYAPEPRGLLSARAAIAKKGPGRFFDQAAAKNRPGPFFDPKQTVLTSSTSEAYSLIFKLLCDPADQVLVPHPSYPLFDLLTRLDAVDAAPYLLEHHGIWSIDRESLIRATTSRTRAVLVVSPNNPTGSMLRRDDREWLAIYAAERQLALIADEVFVDYPLTPRPDAVSLRGETRALTFVLGGLSKSVGLPQMKLAWIDVTGPPELVTPALERLDVIADTYLSVSTPVQLAAARLLDEGSAVRAQILARLKQNLAALSRLVQAHPAVSILPPEGGWSVVVRVPALHREEELVLHLLEDESVIVHPGYFFDFPSEAYLVLSLLPDPAIFRDGVARLLRAVTEPRA
ncbi:MAG TPA: pyridoxal phosphate-dependent aminotransferase [Vicinamibacterales bacterium]|nr:pyridoxal phosphate-dependent aminotransferase [Vicinamibacterales bacterium]